MKGRQAMRRVPLLGCVAAVVLGMAGSASADEGYSDPVGDAGVGTDIVALTVRNDSAGSLSVQVASASPMVSNHAIALFVDADRNSATGSSTGDEYVMYGGPATGVLFGVWNGSRFVLGNPPSYRVFAAGPNLTEFRIAKSDLGNTSGFTFVAVSISIDPPDPDLHFWDFAPDRGSYSYVLSTPPPPPPPTPPTPPPAPTPPRAPPAPPSCSANPDRCPTIFGPSRRSRKDPEYSRFASRMAGGPRTVFCWNESDWADLSPQSKSTITLGFVEFRSRHQINLAPNVCAVLDRIHYRHQRPPITPAIAFGLVTYTHELVHTLGVSNEAAAQCFGMQLAWRAARLLGAGAAYGDRVAKLAWRLYTPRVLPQRYISRECRDGGKLDMNPKLKIWP
jgi:hypothetical protein